MVKEGIQEDSINPLFSIENLSKHLVVQIEGGLLMSRLYEDLSYMTTVKQFIRDC